MTDLDELRRTLRAQESLAPDPDAVLAVATRRIRLRRTAAVAAVVLVVAALGAVAVGVLGRGTTAVSPASRVNPPPAVLSVAGQVPPPAPAMSLEDGSWKLLAWATRPHFAVLHYGQEHQYGLDIELRDGAAPRGALPAKPSAAGQLADPRSVRWQDGPDRWVWVRTTKPVPPEEMLALLAKIRATPPVIDSPLKAVQVPEGQQVATFTSEPETNTLVLCPAAEVAKVPLDTRCFSLVVSLTSRGAAGGAAMPEDPLPARRSRTLGAYTVEVASSPAHEQAARTLLDSVQLKR
ncbi:hypothetical protein ACWED2_42985 [Amycolatopsis sp. NPDC005003]